MALQEKISTQRLQRKVGATLTVLIDEPGENQAIGRSSADAPEIDGLVHIRGAGAAKAGDFVAVRITHADSHDLYGERVS
jgi:ribosomal protein S12 methylthiotransferase